MTAKKSFSKQDLLNHNLSEWIWFVWAVAPKQMSDKFAEYNVGIKSDADVQSLVTYAENGIDVSGTLIQNGAPLSFDTKAIMNAVPMTYDQLNGSNLTYY